MTVADGSADVVGILDLPEEILAKIFRLLDSRSLKKLKLVHSRLKLIVDGWCRLNLCLSYTFLDADRAPVCKFRNYNERYDRIIFRNVKFGSNYQKFLAAICGNTHKISIIANAYLIENALKFSQIREILSSCPQLDELELKLHVVTVHPTEEDFLRHILQSVTKFKFKGEFKFTETKQPISRILQWLAASGKITHLLWSKMGTKIFGTSVTFLMSSDDREQLSEQLVGFLQRRRDHLRTFWVDGFWDYVESTEKILETLAECKVLEQALVKCPDWPTAIRFSQKMSSLRYLRVDFTHTDDYEKLLPLLVANLGNLKGLWIFGSEEKYRRFYGEEELKAMSKVVVSMNPMFKLIA